MKTSVSVEESAEFGKDHGLIHEAVVTGRKVGAGREFWSRLAHDEFLFQRVKDIVCGETEEKETEVSSLCTLTLTLTLPAQPECKVANCFTGKAVFAYRDADFDHWLPETLPATADVAISGYELTVTTTEAELAKVGKPFTSPKQIEDLILRTEKGENTGLITNGYANISFLRVDKSLFTVHANRRSVGWNVRCDRFRPRNEWGAERRFFSPAT